MWSSMFLNIGRRGLRCEPYIYLTFDDGPDPVFTPKILDILAAYDVKANFFVLGAACRRSPQLLRQILRAGHELGVHGYEHKHPWLLSEAEARAQVRHGFAAVSRLCDYVPRFFRPPYGCLRPAMLDEARLLQLKTVLWSRSAMDWGRWGTPQAITRRLKKVAAGDIVLMHDAPLIRNHPQITLSVLPGFLADCKQTQLQFATLSKLMSSV